MAVHVEPLEREPAKVKRPRRYQIGLLALIALVACCALTLWAAREVWQNRDPLLAEERALEARARLTLRSPNPTSRVAAIQALGRLSFADNAIAIRSLTELLGDENPDVRAASAEALGEFGMRAVETGADRQSLGAAVTALIKLLKDPQPGVRTASAFTLGYIASAKPLPEDGTSQPGNMQAALLPAATGATPVDMRAVIAAVTDTLADPEVKVRGAAVDALAAAAGSMVEPPRALAAMLKDESAENREATARTSARYRRGLDAWIPSLLELAEHDDDQSVRARALQALSRDIQPPAVTAECVPALIKGLQSRDRKIAWAATNLLGRLGPKASEAIPELLQIFTVRTNKDETDPGFERQNLAWAANSALGRIAPGSESARGVVAGLASAARSGDRIIRAPAISALDRFGPDAAPAIPVLIEVMRESGSGHAGAIEEEAARTLGVIAPDTPLAEEVVTALLVALGSDFVPARIAAIEALGHFGSKSAIAVPKISSLRDDQNPMVKEAAEHALVILLDERDAQPHE
jgi:HEAT repeat protein